MLAEVVQFRPQRLTGFIPDQPGGDQKDHRSSSENDFSNHSNGNAPARGGDCDPPNAT